MTDMIQIPFHQRENLQRSRRLGRLRSYYKGKQYVGRADFFSGLKPGQKDTEARAPLRERAPCIVYPLPRIVTRTVTRMMFGRSSFPTMKVRDPKSKKYDEELGSAIAQLAEQVALRTIMLRLARLGMSRGTTVLCPYFADGELKFEYPEADHCAVEYVRERDASSPVMLLQWSYTYTMQVWSAERKRLEDKRMWFRRDYDQKNITNFDSVEFKEGKEPEWGAGKAEAHGFAFTPVVWLRNATDEENNGPDGCSLYEENLDEIDALNLALSQRHRGIYYWGTPQPYETGIRDGDGPGLDAAASVAVASESMFLGNGPPPVAPQAAPARGISPASMWSAENEQARFGLLETSGASFNAASLHIGDIRSRIMESMSVVLAGVNDAISSGSGDISARLMNILYEPMISLVSELREHTWERATNIVFTMIMKMIVAVGDDVTTAYGDTEAINKILAMRKGGTTVPIEMEWQHPFKPSAEDVSTQTSAAANALESGMIQRSTAIAFVGPSFGVRDNAAEEAAIMKAQEEQRMQEKEDSNEDVL